MTDPQHDDQPAQDALAAAANPAAATAGEEDHSDPWAFAGEDADLPGEATPLNPEAGA